MKDDTLLFRFVLEEGDIGHIGHHRVGNGEDKGICKPGYKYKLEYYKII